MVSTEFREAVAYALCCVSRMSTNTPAMDTRPCFSPFRSLREKSAWERGYQLASQHLKISEHNECKIVNESQ